jgi:hypothetical protein
MPKNYQREVLRAYPQGFDDALTLCSEATQELAERMRAELRDALDQSLELDRAKGDSGHRFLTNRPFRLTNNYLSIAAQSIKYLLVQYMNDKTSPDYA